MSDSTDSAASSIPSIASAESATPATASDASGEGSFQVRDVFFGRDGLRAVWGILLFLVLRELLGDGIWILFGKYLQEPNFAAAHGGALIVVTPRGLMPAEGVALAAVVGATWVMARLEARPLRAYGFGGRRWLRDMLAGLVWGVGMMSLLVLALRASGHLVFDARLLSVDGALRYGAVWFGGFFLVGLFEESFFRGYLQFTLMRGLSGIYARLFRTAHADAFGFWSSALMLSFVFGLGHTGNTGESPIGLLAAGLVGMALCFSLWRTGSLWWAIGFHAAWDWAQSFVYGVADSGIVAEGRLFGTHAVGRPLWSGGLTGPEGSIFIVPMVGLIVGVIALTLPGTQRDYSIEAARRAPLDLDCGKP